MDTTEGRQWLEGETTHDRAKATHLAVSELSNLEHQQISK